MECKSSDWLILRCSPSRTLDLLEALRRMSVGAWTPIHTFRRRAVRSRRFETIREAKLPTYVFCPEPAVDAMTDELRHELPNFRLMFEASTYQELRVKPHAMETFRGYHEMLPVMTHDHVLPAYPPGTIVKVIGGLFEGYEAVVTHAKDGFYWLKVATSDYKFKLPSFLLELKS